MKQNENSSATSAEKKISAVRLCQILANPPQELIKYSGDESTISLSGYTIEDEYIVLDITVLVNLRVEFQYCTFSNSNAFFFDGLVCNKSVTFDGCTFPDMIYFSQGTFHEDLCFKYSNLNYIDLRGGTFNKISISGYDIRKIIVSGAKFKSLYIGEYVLGENIGELTIFAKANEVGDIFVINQNIDKIFLNGTNKDRKFSFSKIKCNDIKIHDFANEGSLNFYGIEPKDLKNDNRYFQIINSNLDKAQFYRAHFSHYKELIIIDSFITGCLFIGCTWGNNVRALFGPGFEAFEKSVKTGRKITSSETVAIKEAYRQLKISMESHSDKIQENKFYAEELNFHNKTIKWGKPWKNPFWDKVILHWSKLFSDYGQSFIKPFFWLLFGHLILFITALLLNGFEPLHITLYNPTAKAFREAFEKYFIYINPLRKLETSLSGYLIFLDLLMRIWSSYMLYNIIRASRRFIS